MTVSQQDSVTCYLCTQQFEVCKTVSLV